MSSIATGSLRSLAILAGMVGLASQSASAAIISDVSFFEPISHTLIDFETDDSGNPIELLQAQSAPMPLDAYDALGVTFSSPSGMRWTNDGNAPFDAAQLVGGSGTVSIPSTFVNTFTITFSVPVRSFGMFVVNNRLRDAAGPTFLVRDTMGMTLELIQFTSDFYDGQFSNANTLADYGFLGGTYDVDIGSIEVVKTHAIFDDVRFAQIPSPGTLALGGLGLLAAARRRR
jgi:uncharacterized protein (TIGR03382 family)